MFGGTTEGRELAVFAAENGIPCRVFTATEEGRKVLLSDERLQRILKENWEESGSVFETEPGRLTEEEMTGRMLSDVPTLVIDATHPYATEVSRNLRNAAKRAGVRYYRVLRENTGLSALNGEESFLLRGTECRRVLDMQAAVELIEKDYMEKTVLFTTGSKELFAVSGLFQRTTGPAKLYARMLPGEENLRRGLLAGFSPEQLLFGKGPFTEEENIETLKNYGIEVLVTKESGTAGGFWEKLSAAKRCGVLCILIARPRETEGVSMEEAKNLLLSI